MLELWKQLLNREVHLRIREDNEATAKIVLAGYSKRLRHLCRTQKIHLPSLSEQLSQTDIDLMLVNTLFQKADVFTKAVAGPLWDNATKLLSIPKTYDVLRTSSTGLKMSLDQALEPDVGDDFQAQTRSKGPAQVKKAKLRNRRPRRIPQYKEAVEKDNS